MQTNKCNFYQLWQLYMITTFDSQLYMMFKTHFIDTYPYIYIYKYNICISISIYSKYTILICVKLMHKNTLQ